MTTASPAARPGKLRPALLGGLVAGVASAVPIVNFLNCACCALVVAGGFLSAYLYLKEAPPSAAGDWGDVAVVGLLAGLFAAVVTAVVSLPFAFMGMGAGMWSAMQESMQNPEIPEPLRNLFATAGAGGFTAGMIMISLVINLFVYSLFSVVGALIGAAMVQRQRPSATAPPPPPTV